MKKKQLKILIQIVVYNLDIRMNFDIQTCVMLTINSDTRETTEGIELPNKGSIRKFRGQKNYKNLGMLETDAIKKNGDERKKSKKVFKAEIS